MKRCLPVILVIAGCGGGGSDPPSPAAQPVAATPAPPAEPTVAPVATPAPPAVSPSPPAASPPASPPPAAAPPATSPPAASAPPPADSANGATVPPLSYVVVGGKRYELTAGGQIRIDGAVDARTQSVVQLVAWNGQLYQQADQLHWWRTADGTNWESLGPNGDPRPPLPSSDAEGFWHGVASNNRHVSGATLNDGDYWVLYSRPALPGTIAGLIHGTFTAQHGVFASDDAIDNFFDGNLGIWATVNGAYSHKSMLSGSIFHIGLNQTTTFVSWYDSSYEQTPTLAAVAGTYVGIARPGSTARVTVSPGGVFVGSASDNCPFSGVAAPRPRGNVFDVTVNFGGGQCWYGTQTFRGVATLRQGELIAVAKDRPRGSGFAFLGNRAP